MANTLQKTTRSEAPARQAAPAEPRIYRKPWHTVTEDKEGYAVEIFVPGVSKKGVDIHLEDDLLSIRAHRGDTALPEGWKVIRREIATEDYQLDLRLNIPVEVEKIKAKVEDGILYLILPKAEQVRPRQIAVN